MSYSWSRIFALLTSMLGLYLLSVASATAESGSKWLIRDLFGENEDAAILPVLLSAEVENKSATLLTKILGAKVHVLCTTANTTLILQGGGSLGWGRASFTGCHMIIEGESAPECEVHSAGKATGTIETNELKGLLVLHSFQSLVRLEPAVGTTFVTIQAGEWCPVGENIPVQGTFLIKDAKGQATSYLSTHLIEEGPLSSLTTLGNSATIDGSFNVSIAFPDLGYPWRANPA